MPAPEVSSLRAQLRTTFGEILDDKLLEDCAIICQNYNLTGEDLLYKWEAMSFGSPRRVFNADTIPMLKQHIQRDIAHRGGGNLSTSKISKDLSARAAHSSSSGPSMAGAVPAGSTATRPVRVAAGLSKVELEVEGTDDVSRKDRRYRYMYEKVSERSAALDERIDVMAELVKKRYGLTDLGDPSSETEEEVTVVGRIALDADLASAGPVKLNETSMVLESSRAMGSGKRVPLKFGPNLRIRGATKGTQGAGFFPGAIAALRGRNGGGGWFFVTEILTLPPAPPRIRTPVSTDRSFSVCIASGPYTSDSDLEYNAWGAFLKDIKASKPTAILLIGPFIDSNHPLLRNGDVDKAPEALFRDVFLDQLTQVLDELPGSIALLVPSVRDILSDYVVLPQPKLHLEGPLDPRITMLPNPGRFSLDGVSFAVCSADVLFHLRKEEVFKRASEIAPTGDVTEQLDAMTGLCKHILAQRSFYPIFPVPLSVTHEVNLDITSFDTLRVCDESGYAPDVLILPSKLKQFVKNIDHTIALNPSFFMKGNYSIFQHSSLLHEASLVSVKY